MQKISFYLLPNRIKVRTAGLSYVTENRQVYQRKLKIYKGIDNRVEFEVLNSDSRKESVVDYEIKLKVFDAGRNILIDDIIGQPVTGKPGLMSVTFTKDIIANIDPQQLKIAAYLSNDTEERILYSDSQYELSLTAELIDGYNGVEENIEELTVFNYENDRAVYISEIGNFGRLLNDDYETAPSKSITVELVSAINYQGIIEVEASKTQSTAIGNQWTSIGGWNVATDPNKTFTGDWRFIRFLIIQERGTTGPGAGARFTVVKNDGVYTDLTVTLRGQNYLIGDILTIPGSQLGGVNGINDITITVTGLINGVTSQGNVDTFIWTGIATAGSAVYQSIGTDPVARPPNPVDKIIIRS
jgi:hypothetical protein